MSKKRMYKGLPLVDAAEDLQIEIKKGDINTARQKDPANCAAANAAKRVLHTEVEVHVSRIYVKDKNRWVRFITPESISREIISFDRGAIFEPGEYTFKAPTKGNRLGHYKHEGGERTRSGTRKKQRLTMNIRETARHTIT
jgi:hypothetical protein